MIRSALTWSLLIVIVASLAVPGPARAAKVAPVEANSSSQDLYVPDGKGGFRLATVEEKLEAIESPSAHGSGKTSFIDIKRYDLGLYTLLVFGSLYLFIQYKVWPMVAVGLKKREASIEGARDEAQKDRQAAEQRLNEAKRQLDEAADRAKGILDAAHKQAEAATARAKEEASKASEAAREQSRREIEAAKEAARQELYQEAVQLASMLSAKTIRRQLSPEDHARLLDESLAELKTGVTRA